MLQVGRTTIKNFDGLSFGQISQVTAEIPALEHLNCMFNVVSNLELLFFIRYHSFLQVTRTAIQFQVSLKLGQIGPKVISPLISKNRFYDFFSVAIYQIIFKLAGNNGMYNILNVCEFRPDWTKT